MWVFALTAASLAAFGTWGLAAALAAVLFWKKASAPQRAALMAVALVGLLTGRFTPDQSGGIASSRAVQCVDALENLARSARSYADEHGELPAASPAALSSWRVSLLPYLKQQLLFDRYQRGAPWDGPNNRLLTNQSVGAFQCPNDVRSPGFDHHSSYFAVVDPRTAWPREGGRRWEDFKDGADRTILLIEAPGRDVNWAEPRDLSFDEAVALLTKPPASPVRAPLHTMLGDPGYFYKPLEDDRPRLAVAFADGSAGMLPVPISRELAVALLTVDGGERVDRAKLNRLMGRELNYANGYAFAAFVALALAPGVRLFLNGRALRAAQETSSSL
jgi:hypothetical protein